MKRLMVVGCVIFGMAELCSAGPCGNGSLAGYIALGATGCTIGSNTLYDFQTLSGTAGATPILPANVAITPLGGTFNPGINAAIRMKASTGTLLEALFTYRISGNSYTSDTITLAGSSETVDGAVSDVQNYCAGGTFGPDGVTGCTGSAGNLATVDGVQNQDSTPLGPIGLLSVTDDFTLDGGLAGSATGGNITDRFTAVPEPSSVLFAAIGFALAIGLKMRSAGAAIGRK